MATNSKPQLSQRQSELLRPREAARELRVAFPTIKQWIYKRKIRSIQTAGGHHRIPQAKWTACYTGREHIQRLSEADASPQRQKPIHRTY